MSYTVRVGFDAEEHVYFVLSSDIPGLNIETETFDEFMEVVADAAPDLVGRQVGKSSIKFEREVALAQ